MMTFMLFITFNNRNLWIYELLKVIKHYLQRKSPFTTTPNSDSFVTYYPISLFIFTIWSLTFQMFYWIWIKRKYIVFYLDFIIIQICIQGIPFCDFLYQHNSKSYTSYSINLYASLFHYIPYCGYTPINTSFPLVIKSQDDLFNPGNTTLQ